MKIISWNVNGIRAVERKEMLEPFLKENQPDIFFIQETKSKPEQIKKIIEKYDQYQQFYESAEKPGYSGVSCWVKKNLNITNLEFVHEFENNSVPDEGRVAQINFTKNNSDWSILGIYFPNGGKSPKAWQDKLKFYDGFLTHINQLRSSGRNVIFCGDVNCAHHEIDLARPKDNDGVIGFHPEERRRLTEWTENQWCDIWRDRYPNTTEVYSWWHLITRSRARNVGWRIDYFFVDKALTENIKSIKYLTEQMGSDHCPVCLEVE